MKKRVSSCISTWFSKSSSSLSVGSWNILVNALLKA
jgi:hypothetical protein